MNNIKNHKITIVIFAVIILLGVAVSIPSLAKLKNRNTIHSVSSWDGTVATSYKSGDGTVDSPYIISNGNEFAFFVKQLESTNYEGKYFELSNDIIINSGIYSYSEVEGLRYTVENIIYYVKENTNEYYDNVNREGNPVGTLNKTSSIKDFKGNFNGKSFTIFGLHITDPVEEDQALFKNLEGTLTDLYIKNSVVSGNGNVAGIAVNAIGATLTNVVYDGYVLNNSSSKINKIDLEPISITGALTETTTMLGLPQVEIEGGIKSVKIVGEYQSSNADSINTIKINGVEVLSNSFEIDLTNNTLNEIPVMVSTNIDQTSINFSNLQYKIEYVDSITSGISANSTNTSLKNVINKADVYGNYLTAGFVGKSNESLQITQSYNTGNIVSEYISGGLIGLIKNNLNHTSITNSYNTGLVSGITSGDIISIAQANTGLININNSINVSNNYAVNTTINSTINVVNSYSINGLSIYNGTINGEFTQTTIESLYTKEIMIPIMYNEFVSFNDVETNVNNVWIYEKNSLPILYIDDSNNPIANINISKYSWNNLSTELDFINFSNNYCK